MEQSELDLLDSIGNPVFVLDLQPSRWLTYIAWNQAAVERSGFSKEQVIGKTAREIYPGRLGRAAYDRHAAVAESGMPASYEIVLPLSFDDRVVKTTLMPLRNAEGKVHRLIGSSIDLSSERQQQTARILAAAEVKALTSEMEQFVAMAAHDLRTPMLNVQEIAYMLRDGFEDHGDGKLELIELLETVSIKATTLISEVLSYARAVNAEIRQVEFDFGELCANIFTVLDPQEEHRLVSSAARLISDDVALQIILRNLIDNAVKHSGRGCVDVRICVAAAGDDCLEFTVRDNGRGFDDPSLAFLSSGTFRTESGFGLLGIKRLVNARGGKIHAEVPKDQAGTIISFTFPGKISDQ
ncbi:PAS domain-containing sensor histidine kinase [Pelagibius sp. Alg239-R121]|uniref:sensor histidine kinase n=1 Tax=Pelagibius sp. Alg239-R121 TaxID=2993448 RepID=UPI0024A6613C|nr:PAS domain-containing sensor histidine kinase [Pelagibius sp. Alg239-R121]